MGQVKIPGYSHRLMHRKTVTCELHDSYFCLMTIKHAIPKILSGRLNYYITRWRQEVSEFGDQLVRRCWNENMSQRGWVPRPPVEQSRRTRTTHGDVRRDWWGLCCCSLCSVCNSLSHTQPFQIKWEVYLFKEVFAHYHCVVVFYMNQHMTIQQYGQWIKQWVFVTR